MESDGVHLKYDVTIRQQPQHARISAMKVSADRRPVDPPIIVQLSVSDAREIGTSASPSSRTGSRGQAHLSHLRNPYYFMYATLVESQNDNEVKYVAEGGSSSTAGALVASVRVLKDYPNADQDAAFFIFPNICVRLEGSWRFKLSLFVIEGDKVKLCATTYSSPFYVYQGKQYPGVQVSTPLTRALAAQGVKLRIRKDIRQRGSIRMKEEEEPVAFQEVEDNARSPSTSPNSTPSRSPPKRRRTLTSSTDAPHSFDLPPTLHIPSDAVRIPRHQQSAPASASSLSSQKLPPYDMQYRRTSLDQQAVHRSPYSSREWFTDCSLLTPYNGKTEPIDDRDYTQWGMMRNIPADNTTLLRQASAPEGHRSMYSTWAGGRDFFAQTPTAGHAHSLQDFSTAASFWQLNHGQTSRTISDPQSTAQRLAWTGRPLYGATQ
ncbi:velvet domain-containing protein [Favolaschia claudopus]|uniref:Velvet domain-containing protein n=1 Tax=Favolaschia claudopus TaxID=2862362 RepID=A0AAW0BQ54_9AGAR